jgi:hypothetical protein
MIRLTCEKEPDDTQSRRGDYTEGFAKRKDGKRSQESGDRRQETGIRGQESGGKKTIREVARFS